MKSKLTTVFLASYPAELTADGSLQIHITGEAHPTRRMTAGNIGEVRTALDAYAEEVRATGKPAVASVIHMGGPALPGLRKMANENIRLNL